MALEKQPTLASMAEQTYQQALKAYDEAITSREKFTRLCESIPVANEALYQRVQALEDTFVQVINAAWHAKYAAEKLMEDVRSPSGGS